MSYILPIQGLYFFNEKHYRIQKIDFKKPGIFPETDNTIEYLHPLHIKIFVRLHLSILYDINICQSTTYMYYISKVNFRIYYFLF